MNSIDFNRAKMRHQIWRLRLRNYLDGRETISLAEATSPHECALGKWLYSEGRARHGTLTAFKTLEAVHARMHSMVERIIGLNASGDREGALLEFQNLLPLSEQIMDLLTMLERQVG